MFARAPLHTEAILSAFNRKMYDGVLAAARTYMLSCASDAFRLIQQREQVVTV
jgi:hypothetical protein